MPRKSQQTSNRLKSTSCFEDRTQRLLLFGAAFCLIAGDNRCWISISTWLGGFGATLAGGFVLLSGVLLVINLLRRKTPLLAYYLIPVAAYYLLIGTWHKFGLDGSSVATRLFAMGLPLYAMLSLDRQDKVRALYCVGVVFAALMGLSAAFFLLTYIGVSCPYFSLESSNLLKVSMGMHYEISYLGGSLIYRYGNLTYCGVFDEAGCVGTFAALLYIALRECSDIDSFPHARVVRAVILLSGVLSFSFAFFLLVVAYLVYSSFKRGNVKLAVGLMVLLIVAFTLTNIDLPQLSSSRSLSDRLEVLFSGGGFANNRVNDQTAMIMREFYKNQDPITALFGYGPGAFYSIANSAGVDGCSVEFYLYDYGYLGFALYYIVLVVLNRCSGRSLTGGWALLVLFLVSTYQRPEVISSLYLAILVLGSIPERCSSEAHEPAAYGRRGRRLIEKREGIQREGLGAYTCR